jgi:hypothetical protein
MDLYMIVLLLTQYETHLIICLYLELPHEIEKQLINFIEHNLIS